MRACTDHDCFRTLYAAQGSGAGLAGGLTFTCNCKWTRRVGVRLEGLGALSNKAYVSTWITVSHSTPDIKASQIQANAG